MTQKKATPRKAKARNARVTGAPGPRKNAPSGKVTPLAQAGGAGFPIVGIGASAGGLEAIEELFRNMPPDTGMGFVLVQHLDPHHRSILSELVARFTRMPVVEATHGLGVEPNHVYVIPPKSDLAILNGVLQLMEPSGQRHLRLSIDYFFRSLAQDQGPNAFCIVLSGAGSDGALGLRAIKGEGGVVLVQDPQTAAYDSMPRSADDTGLADAVLPPGEMGLWLQACGGQLRQPGRAEQVNRALRAGSKVDRLFVLVRNRTGYDFSQYKEGTIGRRIERRMVVNGIGDLDDYVGFLQRSPDELDRLWKEFLIRVTQFFRNPKAFTALEEKVIPGLFINRPPQEAIRIWVPGCSTGEEAYSIAMQVQRQLERMGRTYAVQIFATDIDEEALDIARAGVYPNSIAADVPGGYLRRYFVKHAQGLQVAAAVRGMLVFSRHDITRDPPFSRMDLIGCRNLLIYMRPELQLRVLDALTYALKSEAVLFLGSSESLGKYAELYQTLDARAKLYRRHGAALRDPILMHRPPRRVLSDVGAAPVPPDATPDGLRQLTQAALLADHTPACAVIDGRNQVQYIHGHTGMFLEPAMGRASMDILKMTRDGLRSELASAIRTAADNGKPARFEHLRVHSQEGTRRVNLSVRTLPRAGNQSPLLMVLFEDAGPEPQAQGASGERNRRGLADDSRIAWLEQELADTRETLQHANEELESSNEELQSTVEELQSSNEELMTSQEELSSINEELHTVNVELEDKVHQLETVGNDLENLLVSTEIATVFLDLDLNVRRFTPAASKVINLIASDIGRPLADIVHKLDYDDLIADAEAVLDNVQPRVLDVRSRGGTWYSLRINLYRTGSNAIDGVVLTFVDLTERVLSQERFLGLLELAPDATVITDTSGEIVQVNTEAERLFGYRRDALLGRAVEVLLPVRLRDRHGEERRAYQHHPRVRAMGQAGQRLIGLRKDGGEFPADIAIGPIQTPEGKLFVASVRDASQQQRTRMVLERTNRMFHEFCEWNQARFLGAQDPATALRELCRRLVEQVGYRQCWIGLAEKENPLAPVAHRGFPPGAGTALDPAWVDPGNGPAPRVLHQVQDSGPEELRTPAAVWGCNALLAAPMMVRRQRMGLLVICAAEPDAFAHEEVRMWQTLATSLGVMLSLPQSREKRSAEDP
jgi:two-component system CheB/CheR fusion protein